MESLTVPPLPGMEQHVPQRASAKVITDQFGADQDTHRAREISEATGIDAAVFTLANEGRAVVLTRTQLDELIERLNDDVEVRAYRLGWNEGYSNALADVTERAEDLGTQIKKIDERTDLIEKVQAHVDLIKKIRRFFTWLDEKRAPQPSAGATAAEGAGQ